MTWRSVSSGSELSVGSSSRRSKTLAAVHTAARSLAARNGVASAASSCRQVCASACIDSTWAMRFFKAGARIGWRNAPSRCSRTCIRLRIGATAKSSSVTGDASVTGAVRRSSADSSSSRSFVASTAESQVASRRRSASSSSTAAGRKASASSLRFHERSMISWQATIAS